MGEFLQLLLQEPFFQTVIAAAFLASIAGGLVGCYVVTRRITFIAGSISHSLLAGIGLFLWLNRSWGYTHLSPFAGAMTAAIGSALIISWLSESKKGRQDAAIAAIWALGMAIGILFFAKTPGFAVELSNYLVGNILWVSHSDLVVLTFFDFIVIIFLFFFHHRLLQIAFCQEQARLQGIATGRLNTLLLVLVACATVILMQTVGIILTMSMLTLPPTIADLCTKRFGWQLTLSVIFSLIFSLLGVYFAFIWDLPVGATIATITGIGYLLAHLIIKK